MPASDNPLPQVITDPVAMQQLAADLRRQGKTIGLVPTMGALHAGHLSLVHAAKREADVAVATIFVNPTQFAPHEDFAKYPRTFDDDLAALASAGCEYVFAPSRETMYPAGFSTSVTPPAVAQPLEGVVRPGHFGGVATVVLKLFNLVPADVACFGQKDYQQALVIRHMARDLNVPVKIVVCPIIRDPDGLAMSSRNRYLSPSDRQRALALSHSLRQADDLLRRGQRSGAALQAAMRDVLQAAPVDRLDYAVIVDRETLDELPLIDRPAVALVAAVVGTTRLIDNLRLDPPS